MAAQTFLPDVDRTRRAAGWILIAIFGLPFVWLVVRVIEAGRVNLGVGVLFLILSGLLALGLRLAFWPQEYFEIDLETRKFDVIRKGKRAASGPLDSLGPLEVRRRTREVGTDDHPRTVTEYVVRGAVHSAIDLYALKSPGKARRKMERLARAWHLPCQSWGGAVRKADDLDTPLHERLRGDGAARKAVPLDPAWGVSISPASMGYGVTSTHRSYAPLYTPLSLVVVALIGLYSVQGDLSFVGQLRESAETGDPLPYVLAGVAALATLFFLSTVFVGVRDTFFPGTVRIDDRGVSYRGRTMRFQHIEEVTAAKGVEIVGDRRVLALADTFCPSKATDAVAHELTRLIIEVASSHET